MPQILPALAIGGGAGAQGILGSEAAKEQMNALKMGQRADQMDLTLAEQAARNATLEQGRILEDTTGRVSGILDETLSSSRDALAGFFGRGRDDLTGARDFAQGSILQGLRSGSGTLSDLAGMGPVGTRNVLGGGSRLAALADGGFDISQDAGFQFELEQGKRALDAKASASGGRVSGKALKELAGFSQGLAATRAGEAFNRQFASASAADQLQANLLQNQAGRELQAGLSAQGINANALSQLAGMQFGAGTQAANISTNMGSQLANMSVNQGQSLASLLGAFGQQQAGLQGGLGQALAGLAGQRGNLGLQTFGLQQGINNALVPFAGSGTAAFANTAGQLTEIGGSLFSDAIQAGGKAAGSAGGAGTQAPA